MKLWLMIALVLGLVSCGDVSRSDKLDKIAQLSTVVEASNEYLDLDVSDSLRVAAVLGHKTKLSIKENLGNDTLTLERAMQIDAYTRHIVEFEHLQKQIPIVQGNAEAIRDALSALKSDIEQEAGNRAKYDDQLELEEKKIMTLMTTIDSMIKIKNDGLSSFYELHNKLSDFSLNLVENTK